MAYVALVSLLLMVLLGVGAYAIIRYAHTQLTLDRKLAALHRERDKIYKQLAKAYSFQKQCHPNSPEFQRVEAVIDNLNLELEDVMSRAYQHEIEKLEQKSLER